MFVYVLHWELKGLWWGLCLGEFSVFLVSILFVSNHSEIKCISQIGLVVVTFSNWPRLATEAALRSEKAKTGTDDRKTDASDS